MAPGVEFSEEPADALWRRRILLQRRPRPQPTTDSRSAPSPAARSCPALQVLDAVQNGTVECGQTAAYYYVGKDPTFGFACTVPFGLNTRQQQAWMLHGGGLELINDFTRTTSHRSSSPATPARRWAAGSARR